MGKEGLGEVRREVEGLGLFENALSLLKHWLVSFLLSSFVQNLG